MLNLGVGAADGTPCGSGQSCLNKQCVGNSQASVGTCLYGDDLVSGTLIFSFFHIFKIVSNLKQEMMLEICLV